jgi:hypothetical protein
MMVSKAAAPIAGTNRGTNRRIGGRRGARGGDNGDSVGQQQTRLPSILRDNWSLAA